MKSLPAYILIAAALLLSGCTAEDVPATPVEQEGTEQETPQDQPDDTPGLEGMPEDGRGTIYF